MVNLRPVVNVKVKHIRPKYANLKEWMDDPDNIYIGRAGIVFIDKVRFHKTGSVWQNPFKVGQDGDRSTVIEKYETYIRDKIERENLRGELLDLKGKRLGCWCAPEGCHGDLLVKLIDEFSGGKRGSGSGGASESSESRNRTKKEEKTKPIRIRIRRKTLV